jgi:hypothetical protein
MLGLDQPSRRTTYAATVDRDPLLRETFTQAEI